MLFSFQLNSKLLPNLMLLLLLLFSCSYENLLCNISIFDRSLWTFVRCVLRQDTPRLSSELWMDAKFAKLAHRTDLTRSHWLARTFRNCELYNNQSEIDGCSSALAYRFVGSMRASLSACLNASARDWQLSTGSSRLAARDWQVATGSNL